MTPALRAQQKEWEAMNQNQRASGYAKTSLCSVTTADLCVLREAARQVLGHIQAGPRNAHSFSAMAKLETAIVHATELLGIP